MGLEAKITAVEKQLHAAVGEKHKQDAKGNREPCRIPSLHQINTFVERTRKRLKYIEEIEGHSKCTKFLQKLQGSNVSHKNVARTTRAPGAIMSESDDSEYSEMEEETVAEEPNETAEAILKRAVAQTTPAAAKQAAK